MKNKLKTKAAIVALEKRLRGIATWECTQGNRRQTNNDEIFEQAKGFRRMVELGMFKSMDELETTVFNHWGLDQPVGGVKLEFSDVNPVGGG